MTPRFVLAPISEARIILHVKSEEIALTKRTVRTSIVFACTLLGSFLIHNFWFAKNTRSYGEWLFDSLVAAGAFFIFDSRRREYDIEVTDDLISMRRGFSLLDRSVRRGHIHFFHESHGNIFREPALRLSEHGIVYRFLFGYVWIPANIPEYELIKTKAFAWVKIG
jgi:hypothetical protein